MEIKRSFDLLTRYETESSLSKNVALAAKYDGIWKKFSVEEYREYVDFFSIGLLAIGYKKGDKIATVSNNRPEWNFADFGMAQVGVVHVPIYPTINAEEFKHILNHASAKSIIVSNSQLYVKLLPVISQVPSIEKMYTFNGCEGTASWEDIVNIGKENKDKYIDQFIEIRNNIQPNDLLSIIYTSGTTGQAKGVMLSHNNFMSNVLASKHLLPLTTNDSALSFLPLCHVLERMVNYLYQYCGVAIYYAENLTTIIPDLQESKAAAFVAVPRVLEKIYDKIIIKGKDLKGIVRLIFFWAVHLGLKFETNNANGWFYNLQLAIARQLVFRKWQKALGGNIKIIVCGGAALQERLARLFWAAGLPIQEGYGLTETSPVISVNDRFYPRLKFGSVGPLLNNVEVKIADDGEILMKGPNLMLGYYKQPELTNEVIDQEGWFHTGDIGTLDENNILTITDRKKEIFKLSVGKYIAPQVIENILKESIFIEQVLIVGENERFVAAVISPNFHNLHGWCGKHKIHYRDNKELITNHKVIARYQKEIDNFNKRLGKVEQIKKFVLVFEEWTSDTGELSPTQKLKRKKLLKKYELLIEQIFKYI